MLPADRLPELWAKIDEFFERVGARYPGALTCGPGCADCCRRELTVTSVEAARIAHLLASMPASQREAIAARADRGEPCAALDEEGRCSVYAARPLVCRSHGLPLRFEEPSASGRRSLPVLDVCPLNFKGRDLAEIDPACVLDQRTLSVMLGAIDALHARASGGIEGARVGLRDLLRLDRGAPSP